MPSSWDGGRDRPRPCNVIIYGDVPLRMLDKSDFYRRNHPMMGKSGLALLALAAAPLVAQQPHRMGRDQQMMSHMMQMEQMMAPMMRAMAFTPDHLLARKDSLNLTPQQITRLTALRDASKSAHDAAAADAKLHMDELAQVLNTATPDTGMVKAHFQRAHTATGKGH